jgi:biopolymer transport protein ExbD
MKIHSPLPARRTRLEIIPLIDIMFFLLASFMMVSLQMQKVRTVKASLPTATLATAESRPDMINLLVERSGQVRLDERAVAFSELAGILARRHSANPEVSVYITGAADATHGSLVYVLDFVRRAGVSRVAVAVAASDAESVR